MAETVIHSESESDSSTNNPDDLVVFGIGYLDDVSWFNSTGIAHGGSAEFFHELRECWQRVKDAESEKDRLDFEAFKASAEIETARMMEKLKAEREEKIEFEYVEVKP